MDREEIIRMARESEVVECGRVYLTYHADGDVGIGTPPDAPAPLGEPVEHLRVIMSNQEQEAHVFAHSTTEWARVDKDLNVTHLDIDLCAKGPQNVYTALALAIWNKAIAHEREACAKVAEEPYEFTSKESHRIATAIRERGNT